MAKKYVLSENEQRIVDNVSIPQYFNERILPYKPGFRELSAERPSTICPFHADTDPSFHYWKDNKSFHCFGCKVSGNVISLHMRWEKEHNNRAINHNTAIMELAKMYGVELELDDKGEAKVESVFELAKKKNDRTQYNENPFANMSIAGFRTFNNQVKANIDRSPYIMGEQAAKLYHKLDLRLSAYLAEKKEVSKGGN
jgi:hypothetical protein